MTTPNQKRDLELLSKIRNGQDGEAKEELIHKYIPMVKHIVKKKFNKMYEFEDLIQEGLISLLKAIEDYDGEQYAIKFSTFAYICILRKILNIQKYFTTAKYQFTVNTISLCRYLDADESKKLLDIIDFCSLDPQELVIEKLTTRRLIEVLKANLTKIEYTVLSMYLQGLNCGEIGKMLALESKVIDNAKTRARHKLQRIVEKYGSLSNPLVPLQTRRRADLAMKVKVI